MGLLDNVPAGLAGVVGQFLDGDLAGTYCAAGVRVEVSPEGEVATRLDKEAAVAAAKEEARDRSVDEVKESLIDGTMAYSVVNYGADGRLYSSVLVMLWLEGKWQIISDCRSWTPLRRSDLRLLATKTTSDDLAGVAAGANAYCEANRSLDGDAMGRVFTNTARLTFTGANGELVVISAADFCKMVVNRWSSPKHAAYAHLKHDSRLAQADALLSIAMATPRLAVCKLRVVFPPVCFTDFLTYAKFPDAKWRIVAKSTVNEPFLADEKK